MTITSLEKIKNGEKVYNALTKAMFFEELRCATGLESKMLQQVLAKLSKGGYVQKNAKSLWERTA